MSILLCKMDTIKRYQRTVFELCCRKLTNEELDKEFLQGGPSFIAAICIRDNWELMSIDDQQWCVSKAIKEIKRECDSEDHSIRHARSSMRPDRAAAFVLPFVLTTSDLNRFNLDDVTDSIACAMTHAAIEVRSYVVEGIGCFLHEKEQSLMFKYIGAISMEARIITNIKNEEEAKPYDQRNHISEVYQSITPKMRDIIKSGEIDFDYEFSQTNLSEWPYQDAVRSILQIFNYTLNLSHSIKLYQKVAEFLVEEWGVQSQDRHHSKNYEFEQVCKDRLASFVIRSKPEVALQACNPIIAATIEHPKNTADFVQSLILEEDKSQGETTFWLLWQQFADQALVAPWIDNLDSRWHDGQDLINKLFLGIPWKEGVQHWEHLEGNAHRIDELIAQLQGSSYALNEYCYFLYSIGKQSLPNAYTIVTDQIKSNPELSSNCIYYLETLLSRHVYSEPLKLKSDRILQKSVLYILDHLIELGSSSAYRMRDDFITPIAPEI